MLNRHISAVVLALLLGFSASAQSVLERGDVLVSSNTVLIGPELIPRVEIHILSAAGVRKSPFNVNVNGRLPRITAFYAPDRLFITSDSEVLVSSDARKVDASYLGELRLRTLGEIVPMRSGNLLVMEFLESKLAPRLVRFTASGDVVWVREFVPFVDAAYPVKRIELLADQCTLAWISGAPILRSERQKVRGFNICTNQPAADVLLFPDEVRTLEAIRQLPNGDFLIATGSDVRRFDRFGNQLAVYPVEAEFLALTPDASGFWAARRDQLVRVQFATPDQVAVRTTWSGIYALAVVGEWRASAQLARRRAVVAH